MSHKPTVAFNSVRYWPKRPIPESQLILIRQLVGRVLYQRPRPPLPLCADDTFHECMAAAELAYHKWDVRKAPLKSYLIARISHHLIDLYRKFGTVTRGGRRRPTRVEYLSTHERGCNVTPYRVVAATEILNRIFALRPNGTKARQIIYEFVRCLDIKRTAKICRTTTSNVMCILSRWRKNYAASLDGGVVTKVRRKRNLPR